MRLLTRLLLGLALLAGVVIALDYLLPAQMARLSLQAQRAVAGLEEKRLSIPGFEIAYLEGGQGEPLVLVHGIGADKDNFDRVAMPLVKHYRVISIDLPGFGDSSKPADANYGIAQQVERLDQILAALGLTRAHLGGSSMGGWIVASYAARHPQKVGSLWLIAAAGAGTAKESDVRRLYREKNEYMLFAKSAADYDRILDTVFVTRPFVPHSVRQALAARAVENYELHTSIFRQITAEWEATALEPQVRGLPVPTLLMWGDQDRAVDVSSTEVLHALMPRSEIVIYPDVGHLPMLEVPGQAAQDYLAFRSRLGA